DKVVSAARTADPKSTVAYNAAETAYKEAEAKWNEADNEAKTAEESKGPEAGTKRETANKARVVFNLAAIKREEAVANLKATVNTFDLLVLQRAGKAAWQKLKDYEVTSAAGERAARLADEAKTLKAEANIKEAAALEATVKTGVDERLKQSFF